MVKTVFETGCILPVWSHLVWVSRISLNRTKNENDLLVITDTPSILQINWKLSAVIARYIHDTYNCYQLRFRSNIKSFQKHVAKTSLTQSPFYWFQGKIRFFGKQEADVWQVWKLLTWYNSLCWSFKQLRTVSLFLHNYLT